MHTEYAEFSSNICRELYECLGRRLMSIYNVFFFFSLYQTESYDPSVCCEKRDTAWFSPDVQINSLALSLATASLRFCSVT